MLGHRHRNREFTQGVLFSYNTNVKYTSRCLRPLTQPTAASVPVHTMKAHGEVEVTLHSFLPSALDRHEGSASRYSHSTSEESAPGTRWAPQSVWMLWRRETSLAPAPVVQPAAQSLHRLSYPSSRKTHKRPICKSTSTFHSAARMSTV